MTPEEQRIAIANVCGWKQHPKDKWIVIPPNIPHSVQPLHTIPDYLNDLNSMHEAEKMLTEKEWPEYRLTLTEVCTGYKLYEWQGTAISATAPQRAEAFLRTLDLWKD